MNWGGATQLFSGGYHYDPLVSLSIFYLKCNFFPKRILIFLTVLDVLVNFNQINLHLVLVEIKKVTQGESRGGVWKKVTSLKHANCKEL